MMSSGYTNVSFKNRLLHFYLVSLDCAVDYKLQGASLDANRELENVEMARSNYERYMHGADIDVELYEIYSSFENKSGGRIGGTYVPKSRFNCLLPRFEEKFAGKSFDEIEQESKSTPIVESDLRTILNVYYGIEDSVADSGYEGEYISESPGKSEKKAITDVEKKERDKKDAERELRKQELRLEDYSWLDKYKDADNMVTAEELEHSLVGTVTDVKNIHHHSELGKSKLALALDVDGEQILVNVRGAMHRNYGYITKSRVEQLRATLPKENIDVTNEEELVNWFKEAGVKQSYYKKRQAETYKDRTKSVESAFGNIKGGSDGHSGLDF